MRSPVALRMLLAACLAVLLGARLAAPSMLQRFDQPKTATYTADIAQNGRWLLPRDAFGGTATKPPLVNWLAAPLLKLGFWTEPAVKMPMLLGSLATLALTVWMARALFLKCPEIGMNKGLAGDAACLAGIAWLVNPANAVMLYHCRPDPLLVAFLTGAWALGTRIVCGNEEPPLRVVLGFWACAGAAALTKGPAALVPMLYLPLAARVLGGRWSLAHRSRWWWGLPLAVGIFLAWAVPCALRYPEPFWNVLVGRELVAQAAGLGEQFGNHRITGRGPIAALENMWKNPVWFFERFAPWSALTLCGLCALGWRRWFRHPLGPAVLWMGVVLLFFSGSAHKTADYILPAYPAAAAVAAWFCATTLRRAGVHPWMVGAAGFLVAVGLGLEALFWSGAAKDRGGENLKDFAAAVQAKTGGEPVVCVGTGYNTLALFLRDFRPVDASADELAKARWVVAPLRGDVPAELVSRPVPEKQTRMFTLALYRAEALRGR